MVAEGCIHGRFQPFHIEHLEDALAALDRCGFLWIGLAGRRRLNVAEIGCESTWWNMI